jgi:hypothetical protein
MHRDHKNIKFGCLFGEYCIEVVRNLANSKADAY